MLNLRIIGADTGGMREIDPPHFYSSIVSFAVSGWIIPPASKKIFWLAALAIIMPPTCEPESAPLLIMFSQQSRGTDCETQVGLDATFK
jgi:hypothetical protein